MKKTAAKKTAAKKTAAKNTSAKNSAGAKTASKKTSGVALKTGKKASSPAVTSDASSTNSESATHSKGVEGASDSVNAPAQAATPPLPIEKMKNPQGDLPTNAVAAGTATGVAVSKEMAAKAESAAQPTTDSKAALKKSAPKKMAPKKGSLTKSKKSGKSARVAKKSRMRRPLLEP